MNKITRALAILCISTKNPLIATLILISISLPVLSAATNQSARDDYCMLGVFPYLPTPRLEARYSHVAKDLATTLGCTMQLRSRNSYSSFRASIRKEIYDIIYVQPFDYIRAAAPNGYRAIARRSNILNGVFVAHVNSKIVTAENLRGKIVSMPPKDAAVSVLARLLLNESGLLIGTDVHIRYLGNHFACMKQVVLGKTDSCVTAKAPIEIFEAKSNYKFKILFKTQSIPSSVYAIHSRINAIKQKKLTNRILGWSNNQEGKEILKRLHLDGFVAVDDATYDSVRQIWEKVGQQ